MQKSRMQATQLPVLIYFSAQINTVGWQSWLSTCQLMASVQISKEAERAFQVVDRWLSVQIDKEAELSKWMIDGFLFRSTGQSFPNGWLSAQINKVAELAFQVVD
jgi:hypothetical protein